MAELIYEYPEQLVAAGGTRYTVRVHGKPRPDGTWLGWLTFTPLIGSDVRTTERETTQPSRDALTYWPSGVEPVYLEGAFAWARGA